MKQLTLTEAVALAIEKKVIKWEAPIYGGNEGHCGEGRAGGIAQITDVFQSLLCDIPEYHVRAFIMEGDDLNHAKAGGKHMPEEESQEFFFSDSDRFVTFEVLEG